MKKKITKIGGVGLLLAVETTARCSKSSGTAPPPATSPNQSIPASLGGLRATLAGVALGEFCQAESIDHAHLVFPPYSSTPAGEANSLTNTVR